MTIHTFEAAGEISAIYKSGIVLNIPGNNFGKLRNSVNSTVALVATCVVGFIPFSQFLIDKRLSRKSNTDRTKNNTKF